MAPPPQIDERQRCVMYLWWQIGPRVLKMDAHTAMASSVLYTVICTCNQPCHVIRRPRRRPPIKRNLGEWSLAASQPQMIGSFLLLLQRCQWCTLYHMCLLLSGSMNSSVLVLGTRVRVCVHACCSIILSGKTEGKGQVADLTRWSNLFSLCVPHSCYPGLTELSLTIRWSGHSP